jgi:tetratricopeptide (TPR) repeat protein
MSIELIRGELERLYSLDEMLALSSDLLGFAPGEVGGTASTASFARALTDHCQRHDAIAALIDAVTGTKTNASPKLQKLVDDVLRAPIELKPGESFGDFKIVRKIGTGPNGTAHLATSADSKQKVLKLLHASAVHDRSALWRYLTRARLLGKVAHDSLPSGLEAGFIAHKAYTAYDHVDAKPLAPRIARTGALHINEARPIIVAVLNALRAVHQAKLVHGAVKLENVLIGKNEDGSLRVILVDAGGDLLRSSWVHSDVGTTGGDRIKGMAPEQLKGLGTVAQSDLYGFGALLFEVLSGKPPLEEPTATAAAVAHLSKTPPKAKDIAPRGWVSDELSELCARLLAKSPEERPNIDRVLEALGPVERTKDAIGEEELNDRIDALVADPTDPEAAITLEITLERGAEPRKVADAFLMAAEMIDPDDLGKQAGEGEESTAVAEVKAEAARLRGSDIKKSLMFRAARLFGSKLKDHARAEECFRDVLALSPDDDVAKSGLEEALRAQDKLDELVEHLLEVSEKSDSHSDRARSLQRIGQLYMGQLDDREQAVFAFAQSLAQDVQNEEVANELEKAAGEDMRLWAEAMQTLHAVSEHPRMPQETRIALFMRLGNWYSEKIARPDLAIPCFEMVLKMDPAHDGALAGMTTVYRRAQQWNELVAVLLTRTERAPTPERARDLRVESAEILETRLSDLGRARDLYEQTLKEDPGHQKTVDALARIYQRNEDWAGYVKILERQADALIGHGKAETLCKIAELYEDQLSDMPEAERRFQAALNADPGSMSAMRGLDRVYNRTGRYKELLENLEKQVLHAATPRQKINLYERMAGVWDEEFLDHEKAGEMLEKVLDIDASHEGSITALLRHYRALDRWDDVIDLYDKALRVCNDDKRRVDLLLAQGRVLLDFGSPERARLAYEHVLTLEPGNANALEALAHVRAATGDKLAALSAVESLAEKAVTPEQKAELWLRAARILEEHGDRESAIERYKMALDAQPTNDTATQALRAAYLARGDATSAAELLTREIETTDGKLAKARLFTELAQLKRDKLGDVDGAATAAQRSIDLDPTNLGAMLVLGNIAFDAARYNEAATHYAALAPRAELLDKEDAKRMLMRYVDALAKTGSTEKAQKSVNALLELAGNDPEALTRAARVRLDCNDGKGAAEIYDRVRAKFIDEMDDAMKAQVLLLHGRALRLAGQPERALDPLLEAADMSPDSNEPIDELCLVYGAQNKWEEVVRVKQRRLDVVQGDERGKLLLDIGEVLATQLKDPTRAAKTLIAALEERPDDRRVLTRLMKLYSDEKDWGKLIEVVLKLGEGVDDPKQKVKYIHTAAGVAARQLQDFDSAMKYLDRVLELEPDNEKAIEQSIEVREQKGDHEGVIKFLQITLERAEKATQKDKVIAILDKIGGIYEEKLEKPEDAVATYERAQKLDPDNSARNERLGRLYQNDTERYLDKALDAQMEALKKNPFNAEIYRSLRKMYTGAKMADPAWLICQALHVMQSAEPDEERFFKRMRADTSAEARERVGEDDWARSLMHPSCDPIVTAIFQLIERAVISRNAQPLESLGYQAAYALDLSMHPYPMSQTLYYAGGVLGMDIPMTFQNPHDPGGISFLHAQPPCIVLGATALQVELPTQAAAFIAARHLTYYRSGLYIRHLVPTGTGMRSWLFAAIRLIHDSFPVAAELESMVMENVAFLKPYLSGPARDQLASAVSKLLQSGAIDLKKWVAGVDLSADRAGFLVCHDLEVACEMIKASDESTAAIPHRDRVKELTLFSVDKAYFNMRKRLGISIDA